MKTVLVVEDDITFGQECVTFLLKNDYKVIFSHNVENAKLNLLNNKIDIAIIDLMLPPSFNIEGEELLRHIQGNYNNIVVIMMSIKEFRTTEIVALSMKNGAKDFLDKNSNNFFEKLLLSIGKNKNSKTKLNGKSKNLHPILFFTFLFIIITIFLLIVSYLITLIGIPFYKSFIIITLVASSIFVILIATQLLYDKKIKEGTWLKVLQSRIVNLPAILFHKFINSDKK